MGSSARDAQWTENVETVPRFNCYPVEDRERTFNTGTCLATPCPTAHGASKPQEHDCRELEYTLHGRARLNFFPKQLLCTTSQYALIRTPHYGTSPKPPHTP